MENLSLHIEYLLLRHDCVVLPGFGAFINIRHSARFDSETDTWHPMTVEVRYNGALCHDDGLLASSYARKYQVSFQEGRDMLNREIRELIETLEADGEVTIGQLGILYKEEETIRFSPAQSPEQRALSMGYLPAPIGVKEMPAVNNKEEETKREAEVTIADDSAEESTGRKRKFDTDRNYYIAVNKIFARTAASIMIVFLMAVAVILPISDRTREDQASVVPVEQIIRDTASRIAASKADTTEIKPVASETAAENRVETESKDVSSLRYHAIVATFATPAEAEQFIAQHKGAGYELSVVSTRTKSRVSAASSDSSAEVRRQMNEPEFQAEFSEAWVWENDAR